MKSTRSVRILSIIMSILVVIGVVSLNKETVSADTDTTTGLTYTISEGKAEVTGFTAPAGFSGALNIPATLGGVPVTSIEDDAFYSQPSLMSVTIPSGVTNIGEDVFQFCTSLKSITVDTDNTTFKSVNGLLLNKNGTKLLICPEGKSGSLTIPSDVTDIGAFAFSGCRKLSSITIPDSVIRIEAYAFHYCTQITSITIPNRVTSIGSCAFYYCEDLQSITIPGSVTSIGSYAFYDCKSLKSITVETANTTYKSEDGILYSGDGSTLICCPIGKSGSITIPNSVTKIEDNALYQCKNLTSVTIPNSVTSIGSCAFYYCSGLTEIAIPSSVMSIGTSAFVDCASLTSINVDSANTAYKSVEGFLLNKAGTQLICCPAGKTGSVAIPSGVTSILENAFTSCKNLTSVTIPQSVTTIERFAFFRCENLTNITIPNSVTAVGEHAFNACKNLTDAYFWGNAPTMGNNVFIGCHSSFTVHYLDSNTGFENPWNGYSAVPLTGVLYRTHVQDVGWQDYVSDGAVSGTSAQSKRLEAINIKLGLQGITGGIEYRTHVQDIGWQGWVANDALSGTSGQSKRLEAIQIRLTGEAADLFDVYYRVHAQNVGWMGWAKNGESSGTAGYSYRLEAIEVKLVAKGDPAPGDTTWSFIDKYEPVDTVQYKTHVQDVGWQGYVANGAVSGTSGESKRLEAIQIKLQNIAGGIEYRTHVQDYGWMDWVSDDALSGTSGQSKRLEAIQIRLTGAAADTYDIYYCVHAENTGWLDWAKNGESAGTSGFGYRLEAIQIVLVAKGGPAPGMTARAFVQG